MRLQLDCSQEIPDSCRCEMSIPGLIDILSEKDLNERRRQTTVSKRDRGNDHPKEWNSTITAKVPRDHSSNWGS